jgi:hypothetical protein
LFAIRNTQVEPPPRECCRYVLRQDCLANLSEILKETYEVARTDKVGGPGWRAGQVRQYVSQKSFSVCVLQRPRLSRVAQMSSGGSGVRQGWYAASCELDFRVELTSLTRLIISFFTLSFQLTSLSLFSID